MLLNPLTFHAPQSLTEAIQLHAQLTESRLLAGGTFLLNTLKLLKKKGVKTPQHIISLKNLSELRGIKMVDANTLSVGSMTVINDLFQSPLLVDNWAILRTVCRNISTNPVRNMATVGGNLTSRYTWTELGAPLIALNAHMHFIGTHQETETISVEEFFNQAAKTNKILTNLTIPRNPQMFLAYQRVAKLSCVDVPLLAVCIKAVRQGHSWIDFTVAVNTTTSFARRDLILEKFLNTHPISDQTPKEALQNLDTSIYDTRSDDYKKEMFRVSIKRALQQLIQA